MSDVKKPWLHHYDEGVPAEIDLPEISLVDVFRNAVARYGDATCLICDDVSMTYNQVDNLSERIARFLLSQGLQKGERVGIFLSNRPEFVISYYGILKAGGVVMAINPAFRPAEVTSQAVESGVRFLVLSENAYPEIKEIQPATAIQQLIVIGDGDRVLLDDDMSWDTVITDYAQGLAVHVPVSPEDPAVFQYSGGTTGTPKCAIGLHRNLVANVIQFSHWLVNTKPGEETVLVAIPIYHVYGMVLGMNLTIWMGARMVLIPDPRDLVGLLEAIQKYRATVFPGVPNLYAAINHYPPVLEGQYDLSSIKACISGSTTLPLKVKQTFETLTNGHLVEGYGLSEAPTATHCNPILGENRDGSIGLPLPGVDCRIVDLEQGIRDLDVGEAGELIIRGPQVMAGYHQQPKETELTLRDGWLFTGDVARMDTDGYFYLVDRKKDVIKVGGFQVWPKEIEVVLLKHPQVSEAAVAGVRDEEGAEVAKAWVVLKAGEKVTEDELRTFCARELTRYKIPRFFEFRESLPRTTVGKVLRRVLAEEHRSA
ncbi:MAG: long-chain fatty acid--CoA ligase [Anaerolineaceae bacterium]|nr:long-chain fatty acid--CoA ligase [Anaerolineaceae bacterium]